MPHDEALALAQRLHASTAVALVGIECYEGLGAKGSTEADAPYASALMDRVEAIARECDARGLFDADEVLLSAGGSAIFDLVATRLKPALGRPVRGLLRSGCYVTHDHGHYKRFVSVVEARLGCAPGEALRPALEVWTHVQSCPEPGLAILAAGRRDLSFDIEMPIPLLRAARGAMVPQAVPASWKIIGAERPARPPALGRGARRRGTAGRRACRPRHLASLHHLRQVALDADGRRALPRRRRGGHALLGSMPWAATACCATWRRSATRRRRRAAPSST